MTPIPVTAGLVIVASDGLPAFRRGIEGLRQSKVQHFHHAIGSNLDVCGLQIAVDDAPLMRGLERFGDLASNRQCFIKWHGTSGDAICQSLSIDELEDQRLHAVALFRAVNCCDVRMIQGREHLCFPLEAGDAVSIEAKRFWEDLECDVTIQVRIASAIHLPHATFPNLGGDFVNAEARTGCERQVVADYTGGAMAQRRLPPSNLLVVCFVYLPKKLRDVTVRLKPDTTY